MSTQAPFTDDLDSVAERLDAAAAQQDERPRMNGSYCCTLLLYCRQRLVVIRCVRG